MHAEAYEYVKKTVKQFGPFKSVVEIGARNINGSVRELFGSKCTYTATDIMPGPDVDIVADGADWQPAEPVACVVCCETLEHAERAPEIVANAFAMLLPGGAFIVTAAGIDRVPHSGVDGGALRRGEFYQNISETMLADWVMEAGFEACVTDVNAEAGDIYAIAWKPVTEDE